MLDLRGFDLNRVLEMDPEFLDVDGEHMHDDRVVSVGFNQPGELDMEKTNNWLGKMVQLKGMDIYRMKGVLAMAGCSQKFVYQAVHMQFNGDFTEPWGDEPRNNRLIFIGKNLDREMLTLGFESCRDRHQYIMESERETVRLRFVIGQKVLVRTSAEEFSAGKVVAIVHQEPHLPPGCYVPYQVELANSLCVYVPADIDEFIRPNDQATVDAAINEVIDATLQTTLKE